jgi:hypothetical protein
MGPEHKLNAGELTTLAGGSVRVVRPCDCGIDACREWTRVPAGFPQAQMRTVGTLAGDPYAEPTFAEYHPNGTHYWSPDAPIALQHFPYNRCTVQQCGVCGRACLAYVEAGGYYVEPRIRALDPCLITDVPAPD